MNMPENDLLAIGEWCRSQGMTCEIDERYVTVFRTRIVHASDDWARLRYSPQTREWSLYWVDGHGRWHEYHRVPHTSRVAEILEYLENPDQPMYWE